MFLRFFVLILLSTNAFCTTTDTDRISDCRFLLSSITVQGLNAGYVYGVDIVPGDIYKVSVNGVPLAQLLSFECRAPQYVNVCVPNYIGGISYTCTRVRRPGGIAIFTTLDTIAIPEPLRLGELNLQTTRLTRDCDFGLGAC